MDQVLHPGGLEPIALLWVGVLEGLRRLLSIHVLPVDSDPSVMLAEQAVRHLICWRLLTDKAVILLRLFFPTEVLRAVPRVLDGSRRCLNVEVVRHGELSLVTV